MFGFFFFAIVIMALLSLSGIYIMETVLCNQGYLEGDVIKLRCHLMEAWILYKNFTLVLSRLN